MRNIAAHIATVVVALVLFLGGTIALTHADVVSLVRPQTDLVSSATTIQETPDGSYYILINKAHHPNEKVLADWITFFEDREAAPLIMEDISCVVCEEDAPGLEFAESLQSRLAENQMRLRTEEGVLAVSKADAGVFDAMVVSQMAYDAYGVESVAGNPNVVVIER